MGCRRVGLNVSEKKQNVMTRERGLLVPDQLLIVVEFLTIFDSSWITILKSWSKIVGFLFINSFFFFVCIIWLFLDLDRRFVFVVRRRCVGVSVGMFSAEHFVLCYVTFSSFFVSSGKKWYAWDEWKQRWRRRAGTSLPVPTRTMVGVAGGFSRYSELWPFKTPSS